MLTAHILCHFAHIRDLLIEPFDLEAAISDSEPVYFWHTFNGLNYSGYELVDDSTAESKIAIGVGHAALELKELEVFVGGVSRLFFVEHRGRIYHSEGVWPADTIYWLGDGLDSMYRLSVGFKERKGSTC